jgi:hypothetical protein
VVSWAFLKSEGDIIDQSTVFFRDSVAVAVVINRKVRWVENIETIFVPEQAAGRIDGGNEFGNLIGPAIIVSVSKTKNTSAVFIARAIHNRRWIHRGRPPGMPPHRRDSWPFARERRE